MSIGSNLGMSFVANDLGTAPTTATMGAAVNGSAEFTGESTFQKMIAQVLAKNGSNSETGAIPAETGTAQGAGSIQDAGSISDLLGGLLFGNANSAKIKLQTAAESVTENKESGELQKGDSKSSELREDSLATMLAMFDGSFNAYALTNNGNAAFENSRNLLGADALEALIGPVQAAGDGFSSTANQNSNQGSINGVSSQNTLLESAKLKGYSMDGNGRMTILAEINGKSVEFTGLVKNADAVLTGSNDLAGGKEGLEEVPKGMTDMEISALMNGKSEDVLSIGSREKSSAEQLAFRNGMPGTADLQGMKISEGINGIEGTGKEDLQNGIAAAKDDSDTETGSIGDRLNSAYQSQLQSTGKADATDLNPQTQPVEGPEPYSQIREEILSKLEQNGPTEFKMQLEPLDLGQIDIKLKLSEGKLVIDILAADARTQALLTSQVDKLISSMGLQNVQVESVQVSQQMNSQTQDNSQSQGFTMNSAMDFSQRKQQEQSQQASYSDTKLTGTFNLQQDETQTTNPVSRLSARYDSHRMNYAV